MKAKIIQSLLFVACLLGSQKSSAYDFSANGMYFNVTSLTNLTCEFTEGDINYSGKLVIPQNVTYNNRTFTVTSINKYAFRNSSVSELSIPCSVTSIPDETFTYGWGLKKLIIEDGTETLVLGYEMKGTKNDKGKGLFNKCRQLQSLYIGRNLSYNTGYIYGYSPFHDSSTITDITIGNTVTNIGAMMFYDCSKLTNVTIGNSVTDIANTAFSGCSALTHVTIPNSVINIEAGAFSDCSSLTNISIGNSVTNINKSTFWGCRSLTSVTIPSSVTSIGETAFYECTNLTSISIPNSVRDIGSSAFAYSGLQHVAIPTSVTSIPSYLFSGCSNLTSVTIGNSVASIDKYAFNGCSALTSIYSLNPTPPSIGNNNFTNVQYMNLNVYVPQGSLTTYQNSEDWKNFWNMQEFNPTGIETIKGTNNLSNGTYYDIQGHKLSNPKPGLNIINGRKVLIRK